ncbi:MULTISPECIES: RNA polymerase sigma factor [Olivibacter]|jgi:RNA polymerase sigma-70 factor (ECF subfamily)|uniref:RNA polymerase, sigma-24 subunit, ECF subfamily n=2 Tax=Sphingobacteriaceae TaxID=84566 RepID=F4C4I6_SPHS2|nr:MULTISPECIES: sigma-70 family RNA polymerase sigma factor [Olivibacter]MCL4639757.1 sigma-70 family RNA polymerase sigma factor [Olivibacter sp. UJ_SKK_5.1]MDX3915661.1 sigma-70 family RNA polymerase sigma factor [Pseudosphingobacterium sp.]QEL02739.1 sigma-70 family RNA polymerase sigma factor [Olivibacter sp. LS-1]
MDHSVLINYLHDDNDAGLIGIYRLYNKPLLYFVQRYLKNHQLAEEVVADVFVKVWERRLHFTNMNALRAFLYIAAKNICLNKLRGDRIFKDAENIEDYSQLLTEDSDAFTQIVRAELLKSIMDEVQRLPEKQRKIFHMTFIDDMSMDEIGLHLGMSPNAVYTNRSRALATLRDHIKTKDSLYAAILFFYFFQ